MTTTEIRFSIDTPKELLEYIDISLKPKEMEKHIFGEVFTPMKLVFEMLDDLDASYIKKNKKSIFTEKSFKWGDIVGCGMGNFSVAVYLRLMDGLKKQIPDETLRKKHIVENMIYMAELNASNVAACNRIFNPTGSYNIHLYGGDVLRLDPHKEWGVERFNVVLGNPPYSKNRNTQTIYHLFVERFIDRCDRLLFVIPSRWFVAGRGLDKFRKEMITRKDIEFIRHTPDSVDFFHIDVKIVGGVNYFLKSNQHFGPCLFNGHEYPLDLFIDFIADPIYHSLIRIASVEKPASMNLPMLDTLFYPTTYFKVPTNDPRLMDIPGEDAIVCYVSYVQSNGRKKYIEHFEMKDEQRFWRVLTPRAYNGGRTCTRSFGEIFVGRPDEIYNSSYVSFRVNSESEANSLVTYLKTDFADRMLAILKKGLDINKNTCKLIPVVPLDRQWTDEEVCRFLGIERSLYAF